MLWMTEITFFSEFMQILIRVKHHFPFQSYQMDLWMTCMVEVWFFVITL